jgi:hypothetical protein
MALDSMRIVHCCLHGAARIKWLGYIRVSTALLPRLTAHQPYNLGGKGTADKEKMIQIPWLKIRSDIHTFSELTPRGRSYNPHIHVSSCVFPPALHMWKWEVATSGRCRHVLSADGGGLS